MNQAQVCREVLEHVHTSKNMLLHGVLCSGLFNAAGQLFMDRVWSGRVESFLNLMLFLASVTVSQVKVSVRCATVQWFHGNGNALEVCVGFAANPCGNST